MRWCEDKASPRAWRTRSPSWPAATPPPTRPPSTSSCARPMIRASWAWAATCSTWGGSRA